MSVFLRNAIKLLEDSSLEESKKKIAHDLLVAFKSRLEKKAFINNVTLNNVINLLTPFMVNYKVNQVLRLLKEVQKETVNPYTGYKKFF